MIHFEPCSHPASRRRGTRMVERRAMNFGRYYVRESLCGECGALLRHVVVNPQSVAEVEAGGGARASESVIPSNVRGDAAVVTQFPGAPLRAPHGR